MALDSADEIIALLKSFEKESKAIKEDALRMCWFMRGGVTYSEIMAMSIHEREIISKIITDNLEVSKKTGLPYF